MGEREGQDFAFSFFITYPQRKSTHTLCVSLQSLRNLSVSSEKGTLTRRYAVHHLEELSVSLSVPCPRPAGHLASVSMHPHSLSCQATSCTVLISQQAMMPVQNLMEIFWGFGQIQMIPAMTFFHFIYLVVTLKVQHVVVFYPKGRTHTQWMRLWVLQSLVQVKCHTVERK